MSLNRAVQGVDVVECPPLDAPPDLFVSCHGYESRSVKHLQVAMLRSARAVSFGFEFPGPDDGIETTERLEAERRSLLEAGHEVLIVDDELFEARLRDEVFAAGKGVARPHIVADISSMNRTRIGALVLACASTSFEGGCDLDIMYFPSTFKSHKHDYEALEYFGPLHERVAGWASDSEYPLALIVGLGTEPRRAEGIVETVEPDILCLLEPIGDEPEFLDDVRAENRRLLDVGGEPIPYAIRDPLRAHGLLHAAVARLSERARVIVVPLGPKMLVPLAMCVSLQLGPQVGVWRASAGRGVQPVDVQASLPAVTVRLSFGPEAL